MNIHWSWSTALRLAVATLLPVCLMLAGEVQLGLVMSIGLLPTALIPLAEKRKERVRLLVIGTVFGLAVVLGSLLSQNAFLAVGGIALFAFAASYLTSTSRRMLGELAIALIVPVIAIGFSYPDFQQALFIGGVMVVGSLWGLLVSLLPWRIKQVASVASKPLPIPRQTSIRYGIVYGIAAAVAAAVPLLLGWEHVGWVAGATLFVMRPSWKTQELRMWGRLVSVAVGALAASVILAVSPPVWLAALLVASALISAGATQGSRWYITPAFTTFIVFFVLLFVEHNQGDIQFRFNERILETLIGVGIAALFGLIARRIVR